MDVVCQFIRKVQLRRKLKLSSGDGCGTDLKMNVYCSYRVPAGIDGQESRCSLRIGQLISSQELLSNGAESRISYIGIDTHGIAMPDIDLGIR